MDKSVKIKFIRYSPAVIAGSIALLLWSGTPIANKIAVVYMDALSIGVVRSMLAGVLALIIALVLRLPFPKSRHDIALLLISGITSFAIWPILFSVGIGYTTAGHTALILPLIPIMTVLIAAITEKRKLNFGWCVGAAVAVAGTTLLIATRMGPVTDISNGSSVLGDLIILLGCLACAIGYVSGAKLSGKLGTIATTFWGLATTLVLLVPLFAFIAHRTAWNNVPVEGWLSLAWLTLLSSFLGYVLWFYALSRGGIGKIGSLQLAMPLVTLAAAIIVLGESLTVPLMASCIIVVVGTFIAHRFAR